MDNKTIVPEPNFHNAYGEIVAAIKSDICFLPEGNSMRAGFEEAYNDALKCVKTTEESLALLCFQDGIRKFRYISNRLDHSLVDVDCVRTNIADASFEKTRNNIRQWIKYPEDKLISAIKEFVSSSLTSPPTAYIYNESQLLTDTKPQPFDLMRTYMDINFAITNHLPACLREETKLTQLTLANLHSNYVEKCGRYESDSCIKDILRSLQTGLDDISKQMVDHRCVDPVFSPIFNTLREGLKLPDAILLPNVKSYCTSLFWINGPTSFNLAATYNAIEEITTSPTAMRCYKEQIERSRKYLEDMHLSLQRCPSEPKRSNDNCFKNILDGFRNYFAQMESALSNNNRCVDSDFAIIRNKLRDGLKLPEDHLMNVLRAYTITEISDTTLDLVGLYKEVTAGIKAGNSGCFSGYLLKTQTALESTHDDAIKCIENKANVNDGCYQSVLDDIRSHFVDTERSIQFDRCKDEVYDSIRSKARIGLLRLDIGLRAQVKIFGETQIIDAVFDLSSTYNEISNAVKSNMNGCGSSFIRNTQKGLEDWHNDAEKCADNAVQCFKIVLQDIRSFFQQITRETYSTRCKDFVFEPIRTRMLDALKLPEHMLINAIRTFAKTRLVEDNLDLVKLYKDITQILKSEISIGCMRTFIQDTQKYLEDEHKEDADCLLLSRRTGDQQCIEARLQQIRNYFKNQDNQITAYRCSDIIFDTLRIRVREALKHSNRYHIEALKKFAETQIIDATFDLVKTYRVISQISSDSGCFKEPVNRLQSNLQDVHIELEQCPQVTMLINNNSCYNRFLDQIKKYIESTDRELQMNRCTNLTWTDLKGDLLDGWKLPISMLIDSIKVFSNTEIIEKPFDLFHISSEIDKALTEIKNSCQVSILDNTKSKFPVWKEASAQCYANKSGDNCYKRIVDQIRLYFFNEDQKSYQPNCANPVYNSIREHIRNVLKHRNSDLIEGVRVFGGAPATPKPTPTKIEGPTPKSQEVSVPLGEMAGGVDGCFKNEIDRLSKIQEAYRLDAQKCTELNDKLNVQVCATNVYQKIDAYFTSPDRLQCFNIVIKPTKIESVPKTATAIVPAKTMISNESISQNGNPITIPLIGNSSIKSADDISGLSSNSVSTVSSNDAVSTITAGSAVTNIPIKNTIDIAPANSASKSSDKVETLNPSVKNSVSVQTVPNATNNSNGLKTIENTASERNIASGDISTKSSDSNLKSVPATAPSVVIAAPVTAITSVPSDAASIDSTTKISNSNELSESLTLKSSDDAQTKIVTPDLQSANISTASSTSSTSTPTVNSSDKEVKGNLLAGNETRTEASESNSKTNENDAEEEERNRTYAEVVKTKAKPNYFNIYKSIRDNVKQAECAATAMTNVLKKMEQTNLNAAKCRDLQKKLSTACFRKEINGVKLNFGAIETQLKTDKCVDPAFTTILANAKKLFDSGSTLSEMRSFSFYTLSELRDEA